MSHRKFAPFLSWAHYSKKLIRKIENPRHGGFFTAEEAVERGMRFVTAKKGNVQEGTAIRFYLLVDEGDGVIADVKFQVFGPAVLVGAAEAASEVLMRKNYDLARRLSADLIETQVRDKPDFPAFPAECFPLLNLILEVVEEACEQCLDIPFSETDVQTPLYANQESGEGYPGWELLAKEQKIEVIEQVIATEIRPYIALDAGGVHIVDLVEDKDLIIAYEGACTSCYSATGSTLNAIQEILRSRIDPHLKVVPDLSFLQREPC